MLLELLARPARRGALVRRGHGMHTHPVVTDPVKQGGRRLVWGGGAKWKKTWNEGGEAAS